MTVAGLAGWAAELEPSTEDVELARRSLVDTVAVTLAAERDEIVRITEGQPEPLRWAAIGHLLDFDDVHLPSSSHISVVCAPAALATGGGAREYLAGAGVMARLGTALGWEHYRAGWHTTCTAGAPAAAVAAGLALGLDAAGLARAMALAVPAAGGVQRAFGTSGKSLQAGFATDAGVRAARLAAAGASADPAALDQWFGLLRGSGEIDLGGQAVPDGLAIKLHPCCYALQRPISAVRALGTRGTGEIGRIVVRSRAGAMQPLIHSRPGTGLQGKFSMEYAVVSALIDGFPGIAEFTDDAVRRPEVADLLERTEVDVEPGGEDVLAGETEVSVWRKGGGEERTSLDLPQGHPRRPPTRDEFRAKVSSCVGEARAEETMSLDWPGAADLLRRMFPGQSGIAGR
jgi:2-methylcitrate dehydratase PrpD